MANYVNYTFKFWTTSRVVVPPNFPSDLPHTFFELSIRTKWWRGFMLSSFNFVDVTVPQVGCSRNIMDFTVIDIYTRMCIGYAPSLSWLHPPGSHYPLTFDCVNLSHLKLSCSHISRASSLVRTPPPAPLHLLTA